MYLEKAKSTLKLLGKADRFILGYLMVLLYSCMFSYLFTIFSLTLLFASMQYCRGSGNISSRISLEIPLGSPTNFLMRSSIWLRMNYVLLRLILAWLALYMCNKVVYRFAIGVLNSEMSVTLHKSMS